jgi:HEAT repeat protein
MADDDIHNTIDVREQQGDVKSVARYMRNKDSKVREYAALKLGGIEDVRSVKALIKALNDDSAKVTNQVSRSLRQLQRAGMVDRKFLKPLKKVLRSPRAVTRRCVYELMSGIEDARVVPMLISSIESEEEQLACELVKMLGSRGDAQGVEPLIGVLGRSGGAIRGATALALGKLGDERAVAPLIAIMNDMESKEEVATALQAIGRPAMQPLIAALAGETARQRIMAAIVLGNIGDPRAVQPLLGFIEARNSPLAQLVAARALLAIDEERGVQRAQEILKAALKSENKEHRDFALQQLALSDDPVVIKEVSKGVDAEDDQVRLNAVVALGKSRDDKSIQSLMKALEDDSGRVRRAAAESLGEIGDAQAVGPLNRSLLDMGRSGRDSGDHRLAVAEALAKLGDSRSFLPLVSYFHTLTSDDAERNAAWEALWSIRNQVVSTESVEPFVVALQDENSKVRRYAAKELWGLDIPSAHRPLSNAVTDEDTGVKAYAIRALGKLGDEQSVNPLIQMLADDNQHLRQAAAEALGYLSGEPRALLALLSALGDSEESVHRAAAESVVKFEDVQGLGPLLESGFGKEYRELELNLRAKAETAVEEIGEVLTKAARRQEQGAVTEYDLKLLTQSIERLQEAKVIAEAAADAQLLGQVTDMITSSTDLHSSTQQTLDNIDSHSSPG